MRLFPSSSTGRLVFRSGCGSVPFLWAALLDMLSASVRHPCRAWIEWVDSASKPADGLIRDRTDDGWTRSQAWCVRDAFLPPLLEWLSSPSSVLTCRLEPNVLRGERNCAANFASLTNTTPMKRTLCSLFLASCFLLGLLLVCFASCVLLLVFCFKVLVPR